VARSADPVLIAMTKGLVAGTVNVALAFMRGAPLPSVEVSGEAAVVGFLGVVSASCFSSWLCVIWEPLEQARISR
jgi:hypothetical protein